MYSASSNEAKLNYNTHNTTNHKTHRQTVCYNERPCYREKCEYCWSRRLKYMTDQIGLFAQENKFDQMITVLIFDDFDHPQTALKFLAKMRPKILRVLRKHTKSIGVIAIAPRYGMMLPHFHILTAGLAKSFVNRLLKKIIPFSANIRVTKRGGDLTARMKRAIAYLIKVNVLPSLKYKTRGMRLMTSSRGFFTGRPRYKSKFVWL